MSRVIGLIVPLILLVAMVGILRLAFNLKWLAAICLSILTAAAAAATFVLLFVLRHGRVGLFVLVPLTAVICLVMLVIQFFRWLARGDDKARVNAAERDRIIKMVEQGKISSEESRALLEALGRANEERGR